MQCKQTAEEVVVVLDEFVKEVVEVQVVVDDVVVLTVMDGVEDVVLVVEELVFDVDVVEMVEDEFVGVVLDVDIDVEVVVSEMVELVDDVVFDEHVFVDVGVDELVLLKLLVLLVDVDDVFAVDDDVEEIVLVDVDAVVEESVEFGAPAPADLLGCKALAKGCCC